MVAPCACQAGITLGLLSATGAKTAASSASAQTQKFSRTRNLTGNAMTEALVALVACNEWIVIVPVFCDLRI